MIVENLFSGNIGNNQTAALSNSYTDYDFIFFSFNSFQQPMPFLITSLYKANNVLLNYYVGVTSDIEYSWGIFTDNTHYKLTSVLGPYKLTNIYGIKL